MPLLPTMPMTDDKLVQLLERQRNLMISVAAGGPPINTVNAEYSAAYDAVDAGLRERGMTNPNPYSDLWQWYGRWRTGDLPSYQSRRLFVGDMINQVVRQIRNRATGRGPSAEDEPTGWPRVDRVIGQMRDRLASATTEEQFQTVGLLCREA